MSARPSSTVRTRSPRFPRNSASTIARDETHAVNAYLTSRDLVAALAKNNDLRTILSRPAGDFLFRYPTFWLPNNNEYLYQRFQWMAEANVDPITNISTIEVNAFSAEDARTIVVAMLGYAEALVNQMNERAYNDGLENADQFAAEARKQLDLVEDSAESLSKRVGLGRSQRRRAIQTEGDRRPVDRTRPH